MRSAVLFTILFFLSAVIKGQSIPDFKTDRACLDFLHTIKGLDDFYFKNFFSDEEIKKLASPFVSWKRLDLNSDKKPDLVFVGAFAHADYEPLTAMLYLSEGDTYKLVPVVHGYSTSFRPHVFIKKQNGLPLIIVHNYYFSSFEKNEELFRRGDLSPVFCPGDDTLFCKFGSVLDYYSRPSKVLFDSLVLVKKYGWSCQADSFVMYANGAGRYYKGCYTEYGEMKEFRESDQNSNYLKQVIRTIDLTRLRKEWVHGGTDGNSARLRIYHDKKMDEYFDYSLESSFTLQVIYQYFTGLELDLQCCNDR